MKYFLKSNCDLFFLGIKTAMTDWGDKGPGSNFNAH